MPGLRVLGSGARRMSCFHLLMALLQPAGMTNTRGARMPSCTQSVWSSRHASTHVEQACLLLHSVRARVYCPFLTRCCAKVLTCTQAAVVRTGARMHTRKDQTGAALTDMHSLEHTRAHTEHTQSTLQSTPEHIRAHTEHTQSTLQSTSEHTQSTHKAHCRAHQSTSEHTRAHCRAHLLL